jgi:two-component system sensor histidine kinase YesM
MDHHFDQLRTIASVIAIDQDIVRAVDYRSNSGEIDFAVELYNQRRVAEKFQQLNVLRIITNANIIGTNYKSLYYYGMSPVRDFDFAGCSWLDSLRLSDDKGVFFTHFHGTEYLLNSKGDRTVSLLVPIHNIGRYAGSAAGYLLCDFDLESILAKNIQESNVWTAIYDGSEEIYFPASGILSQRQKLFFMDQLETGVMSFRIPAYGAGESAYLVLTQFSAVSGWRMIGFVTIDDNQAPMVFFAAVLIFVAIITAVILAVTLSKSVLLPLNQLVEKYREIGNGNFQVMFSRTGMVELDELVLTSQHMVESISRLKKDIVDEQKKLAMEQVKALQHQINPHFLNNVLQSIKALAVSGDVDSISSVATLLGKVLSYSVYYPHEMADLQRELLYLQDFIKIQNIRFNGLIHYEIHCTEAYYNASIPKLIIQPIVENAITHGYQAFVPLSIILKVSESDGALLIQTIDDGPGMDPAAIDDLNAKLSKNESPDDSGSIGLLNVNRRIKNIYGVGYGLNVKSLSRGLSVTIRIPALFKQRSLSEGAQWV